MVLVSVALAEEVVESVDSARGVLSGLDLLGVFDEIDARQPRLINLIGHGNAVQRLPRLHGVIDPRWSTGHRQQDAAEQDNQTFYENVSYHQNRERLSCCKFSSTRAA